MIEHTVNILLVEDNPDDLELILHALHKHNLAEGIVVMRDGAETLDFLFARGKYTQRNAVARPKVILLDLKLPKVNGLEVLRQVKNDPHLCKIPVVMLTSSREASDIARSYHLGANSFITKPVEFKQFIASVRQIEQYWLHLNQVPEQ